MHIITSSGAGEARVRFFFVPSRTNSSLMALNEVLLVCFVSQYLSAWTITYKSSPFVRVFLYRDIVIFFLLEKIDVNAYAKSKWNNQIWRLLTSPWDCADFISSKVEVFHSHSMVEFNWEVYSKFCASFFSCLVSPASLKDQYKARGHGKRSPRGPL